MFGRRRRDQDQVDELENDELDADEVDLELDEDSEDDESNETTGWTPSDGEGPWDSRDPARPAELPEGWGRLDLGSLLVGVPADAELRMDADEQTQVVNAIAVALGDSVMQLMAYAGPRTSGIWNEVRGEIAANVTSGGGTVEERQGPMGTELRAVVPAEQGERLPARFIGVDGPRWFLRAVITGVGAHDDADVEPILAVLRQVVVVRDDDARPLQEPLPVRLPNEAVLPNAELEDDVPDLNPFERGPEITEIH